MSVKRAWWRSIKCPILLAYLVVPSVVSLGSSVCLAGDVRGASSPKDFSDVAAQSEESLLNPAGFTMTTETVVVAMPDAKADAHITGIAYFKTVRTSANPRSLTFVFSGGPGFSTSMLNLGLCVPAMPVGASAAVRHEPTDDPTIDSLLAVSDVIFLDPVGTGFSVVTPKEAIGAAWNIEQDASVLAAAVKQFSNAHADAHTPVYLVGESYGAIRAVKVLTRLRNDPDSKINVAGLILLSPALSLGNPESTAVDNASAIAALPTYAALKDHFSQSRYLEKRLLARIEHARKFAVSRYAAAVLRGDQFKGRERADLVHTLEQETGLAATVWTSTGLKPGVETFRSALLGARNRVIGRFDGRVMTSLADVKPTGEATGDPSFDAIWPNHVEAFHSYLRKHLPPAVDTGSYQVWSPQSTVAWSWREPTPTSRFPTTIDLVPALTEAMHEDKKLRTFVAVGYYDLAVPFFGTELAIAQSGIERSQMTFAHYGAGHFIYVDPVARVKLMRDLRKFYLQSGELR